MILASIGNHLEVVKFLLEKGANIHAQDDYALRSATENHHLEIVKFLLEKGANIHAQDDDALILASMYGHLDIVKFLLEKGADAKKVDLSYVNDPNIIQLLKISMK